MGDFGLNRQNQVPTRNDGPKYSFDQINSIYFTTPSFLLGRNTQDTI